MVSSEMVNKLNLQKFPHELPYKVSWLSNGKYLLVREQAVIEFQIGGYKDKVVCDIFPMDFYHLLLGRPW